VVGFRVQGSGCRVQGVGFRVQGKALVGGYTTSKQAEEEEEVGAGPRSLSLSRSISRS